ncbi:hypothetical protein BH18ACT4_BH18ACT4_08560 [soil metagenome]
MAMWIPGRPTGTAETIGFLIADTLRAACHPELARPTSVSSMEGLGALDRRGRIAGRGAMGTSAVS